MDKLVCSNIVRATRKRSGINTNSDQGAVGGGGMEIAQWFLAIVINKQYWLYLRNESNMIAKFFDAGSHVMGLCRLKLITFWFLPQSQYSMHFSFFLGFQSMIIKYLQGLHTPIWDYQIKWIYQKSYLCLSRQKICEAQSQQQDFC